MCKQNRYSSAQKVREQTPSHVLPQPVQITLIKCDQAETDHSRLPEEERSEPSARVVSARRPSKALRPRGPKTLVFNIRLSLPVGDPSNVEPGEDGPNPCIRSSYQLDVWVECI